mmetsp:Transcript_102455/g.328388  ORF Transcript_102455/g.328388 Transcript_102455/m.328388 type:complete len:84 (+) Transcript_102455:220-471(+)
MQGLDVGLDVLVERKHAPPALSSRRSEVRRRPKACRQPSVGPTILAAVAAPTVAHRRACGDHALLSYKGRQQASPSVFKLLLI